jgi:hypothetical protein
MAYNPFNKPLQELVADDLVVLINNEVAEGYWIEYKSEFQSNKKIAKSIASFANSFGGWYFVGIEADKTKNIATKICGFSVDGTPDPIAKLRESIKSNIDPVPVFHQNLIKLDSDKAVLVVEIPNNQETPFVTCDGRIYRRISDSSEPVSENNRYAVDRLIDNGRELAKLFEDFCRDERRFSPEEEKQSWVNIFLYPYPIGTIEKHDMFSTDGLKKLIQMSQRPIPYYDNESRKFGEGNLPFNSGQLGVSSIILRQVEPSKVAFNSLMAELYFDGRAKFSIPLRYLPGPHDATIDDIKSTQVKEALKRIIISDKDFSATHLRFFDIKHLWDIIINLLFFYQEWIGEDRQQIEMRFAVTLDNIWRVVPFCDADEWGFHVQEYGLPTQNVDRIRIPTRKGKSIKANFPLWSMVCPFIVEGFGLPDSLYYTLAFKPNTPV